MRRIALITESSAKKVTAMPAYEFYDGGKHQWVRNVIEYMKVRDFKPEDIYFLTIHEGKMYNWNELVFPYPRYDAAPSVAMQKTLAQNVIHFLEGINEPVFIEFHAGKNFYRYVEPYLQENKMPYRIYADGVSLGMKPRYYMDLIEEEQQQKRLKEVQQEKWLITSQVQFKTVHEAKEILKQWEFRAKKLGIEDLILELKQLLRKHTQQSKEAKKALRETEKMLEACGSLDLLDFLNNKNLLGALFTIEYQSYKSQYGKEIAAFTRHLIKEEYVLQTESDLSKCLLRLQIALLKTA